MARSVEEGYGLDEVDTFHAEQDKILLEQGLKRKHREESSDEEVMDIDSDSGSDDEAEYFGKKYPDEEIESEEEGAWGDQKSNYYGADNLEDEETAKQIEQEALRQQKKHLEQLNIDDYVDEEMEQEWTKTAESHDFGDVSKEDEKTQQTLSDLTKLDSKSKRKYLATSHPEFIPLVKELTKWRPVLESLQKDHGQEVLDVKFIALSAYLGAITSYLALFLALSKEDEPFTMKEHPVMEAILSTKEVWRQANELEFHEGKEEQEEQEGESSGNEAYDSASENVSDIPQEDSQSEIEDEEDEDEEQSSDSELDIDVSKPRILKKVTPAAITEDFAEGDIADVDAEEKKTRKKTLRFYTSKIDQQSRKRDEKFSGDQDLPYKERLFERQQRLIEEARQRGLQQDQGAELDDHESDHEIPTNRERDDLDDSLYRSIKSSKDTSKAVRREVHDMAIRAAKEGRLAELKETVGEDGKRAVNFQILKNKGLTPHRNKDNRNSRVKKRKKYEKAQKKLKSVRAVYEQPKGAYEGEKTGIKKNLSKSVKF